MIDFVIVSDDKNVIPSGLEYAWEGNNTYHVEGFKEHNGYNAALNSGISKGNNPIVAACNDDLIFHDHSIEALIAGLEWFDSVSPWCPKTHHQWWNNKQPQLPVEGYAVGRIIAGWCIFLKRSTWEKIGGFDERLKFWCSDNAYAEQLKQHNLSHALIPKAEVTHYQSQTLNKQNSNVKDQLTKFEVKKFNKLYNKNLFNLGTS